MICLLDLDFSWSLKKRFFRRNLTLSPEQENRMMIMMTSVLAMVTAAAGGAPGLPGDLP